MKTYDVAIIGGGPAGLSAALVLARARRSTIVFDDGTPRNAYSPGVYGFPSRDGILPAKLKAMVRGELANYGCVDSVASKVRRFESHKRHRHVIEDDRGRLTRARMIILAIGMVDVFPSWRGFADLWGKDIMHCAHCHGWEMRDRHWGIVADSVQTIASARQYRTWTDRVTVFANPELEIPPATLSRLGNANIDIVQCRIRDLVLSADGRLSGVRTNNDNEFPCETLIYTPPQRAADLLRAVRIKTHDNGRIIVNDRNETNLSRVFAIGDITPGPQNALAAAAEGAAVAKKIIPDLVLATTAAYRSHPAAFASGHLVERLA
jgi:thioredoxin reductase